MIKEQKNDTGKSVYVKVLQVLMGWTKEKIASELEDLRKHGVIYEVKQGFWDVV